MRDTLRFAPFTPERTPCDRWHESLPLNLPERGNIHKISTEISTENFTPPLFWH